MSVPAIIDADSLRACIGFEDLIEPVAEGFRASSAGEADNGLVVMFPLPSKTDGDVYVKTGTLQGHSIYVVKISPWFAQNVRNGVAQGGFVAAFDSRTGHTLAILEDEHYLSDIRTAAAGAVAARALAPRNVRSVTVLGSGVQAYWQSLALYRERAFETLRVWARDALKAEALVARLAVALPRVSVAVSRDPERSVREADIIVCATSAREPIVFGEWLRDGQHITAVGADDPTKCELDVTALRRGLVFVDSRDTAVANGDIHRAIRNDGYARDELAGEIGEVLSGATPGRRSESDVTICKLIGIGAQDLVAAETALAKLGLHGSGA